MDRLLAILLTVMSGVAFAQTTGTVNPNPAPAEPSVKDDDVPPGGCMPTGLTASGEMVFPLQCKEFLERQRGMAVEKKPDVEENSAVKQSEGVASEKSVVKPVEAVPLPKGREPATSSDNGHGCQHYRTYNPASGMYTGYDGRRHSCP